MVGVRLSQFCVGLLLVISPTMGMAAAGVPVDYKMAPCTYFVSVTGSDRNNGTSPATPLASLEKAQSAARRGGGKVVCLRAGTYQRTGTLTLTSADDGETWQSYPPDGVNTAVLDGGSTVADVIHIVGGSNITIDGLKIQHFINYGINGNAGPTYRVGASSANTIKNCDIGFNTATSWNSAGIGIDGAWMRTSIRNNYVHDVGSMGILLGSWERPDESIDGSVIERNVVLRSVQRMRDGGAIYVSMHGGTQASRVTVRDNYIKDYGGPGVDAVRGIYLDDNANNVTVSGNIVGPPALGAARPQATIVHNGHDNQFIGNIFDLGQTATTLVSAMGGERSNIIAGMAGITYIGNIVISNFAGRQNTDWSGIKGYSYNENIRGGDGPFPMIKNNVYHNYGGGDERSDGNHAGDANPVHEDPQISGWTYQIAANSPVFAAPVNFSPLVGQWGPPGFTIPETGSPPSSPH